MPVAEPLPAEIEQKIKPSSQPRISFASDIDHTGRFGEEWLVLTDDRLLVLAAENGSLKTLHDIALVSILSARIDTRVGSGILEIRLKPGHGSAVIPVLRFSNALS